MKMSSAYIKSAIVFLIGMMGLFAGPAGAQKPPRLLFLGISKDGRPQQPAESAVQLRLEGLGVEVIRARESPPCEHADCLAAALAQGHADLALTGRILRNEHACLATLWLAADRGPHRPIEQDITCRSDGKDGELGATLADGAAGLIDDYLRGREPAPEPSELNRSLAVAAQPRAEAGEKKRLSGKKKALIAGLGILLAGGIAATITFASVNPTISQCEDSMCFNIMSFRPAVAISGLTSGAILASLLYVSIK